MLLLTVEYSFLGGLVWVLCTAYLSCVVVSGRWACSGWLGRVGLFLSFLPSLSWSSTRPSGVWRSGRLGDTIGGGRGDSLSRGWLGTKFVYGILVRPGEEGAHMLFVIVLFFWCGEEFEHWVGVLFIRHLGCCLLFCVLGFGSWGGGWESELVVAVGYMLLARICLDST